MAEWFLLVFTIHGTFLLAGPYAAAAQCQQDKIIVETFSRYAEALETAPRCIERPAKLTPQWKY